MRIINTNDLDSADTLTATSEASGFLIANIQDNIKTKTWRSTDLTAQTITATWTAARLIGGFAAVFTNLIAGSTIQVKLYTLVGDGSPAYDSGAKNITFAYPAPSGFTTINSTSFAYGGGNHYSFFFPEISAEKIQVIVNSSGNPDSFMEISRLTAGSAWSPEKKAPSYGVSIAFDDTTNNIRLESGDQVSERNPMSRVMRFDINFMTQADKQQLNTIMRSNGVSVPVFVSLQPSNSSAENELSTQIFGRFQPNFSSTITSFDKYDSSIEVREI